MKYKVKWKCGLYIHTNDVNGEYESADETTLSYTIENLEGCISCRVTVFALNAIGYGRPAIKPVNTEFGRYFKNLISNIFLLILNILTTEGVI